MRLRFAGICRRCQTPIPANEWAIYDRTVKQVECVSCPITSTGTARDELSRAAPNPVEIGVAGNSARREHERRVGKREQQIRTAHPHCGGLILALTDDPQSTRAWERGAIGEERLGQQLDLLAGDGVRLLHDRRIPRTRANIDHIAITDSCVFVVDAKRYHGRPQHRIEGGLVRPRVDKLMVGTRDCTKLLDGVNRQIDLVTEAVRAAGNTDVAIRGMLCFVDADWPLIGGSFAIHDTDIMWPKKAGEAIRAAATTNTGVAELHAALASAFPAA